MKIKKRFSAFILLTIILIALTGFKAPHLQNKNNTLVFAGNDNFAPYSFFSGDKATGFSVDLMKSLASSVYSFTSKNIEIKLMPWEECIIALKTGEIDGLIGVPVHKGRVRYLDFSTPVAKIDFAIFVDENNRYVNSLSSLEGTVVGIPEESPIVTQFIQDKRIQILETNTIEEALLKLKNREITAVIAEKNVALYYIQENKIEGLKVAGEPVGPIFQYAIAVKKNNAKLLKDLNLGLLTLQENGTLNNLKRKWFGIALTQPFPWRTVALISTGTTGTILLLSAVLWVLSLNRAVKAKTRQIHLMAKSMVEKDKLIVLGKLAGQIAHELRTPLSIINNSVFLLRKEGSGDKELFTKRLRILEDKVKLTSNILESILSYSRVKAEIATTISVKECVEETIKDLEVPEGLKLKVSFKDDRHLRVFMDFHQLYSVIRNLTLNSLQAMGPEGTLIISAFLSDNKKTVNVRVCDTGKGIMDNAENKIFNLFYSSKITGTGLGLPISKSIIEANDGKLTLEETSSEGTCFLVELPSSKYEA